MNWLQFLRQFVSRNMETGAVATSSRGLAELITDYASVDKASVVIELGPGTGVFTRRRFSRRCSRRPDDAGPDGQRDAPMQRRRFFRARSQFTFRRERRRSAALEAE